MPSSFKILRGAEVDLKSVLPLSLRSDFPVRGNGVGNPAGPAGEGETGLESSGNGELALAREKAREIIAGARSEAEDILLRAREEAAAAARELAREAREEGYREGYERGYQEGLEKAGEEGEAIRKEAREVLAQAHEIRQKTIAGLEGEIASLAREIAEKILATQLTLDPQVVLAIVREAVAQARGKKQVILYVHPDDLIYLQEKKEELQQALSPGGELYVLGDPAVERGGCLVETEDSRIEATLRERWQALTEALQA
jgi:flagellar assembly protein FliH